MEDNSAVKAGGSESPDRGIRTYVLRTGRMTEGQKRAVDELGPRFCIPFNPERPLDFPEIFGNERPVICEIGFGMGLATWRIARERPDYNYLGIEVHTPGVGKLLAAIEEHGLSNIRILHHDAVEALERVVAPASLSGFHIFYPDPWPKKRHHKRRLMRPGIVELLTSRLKPGGYLYFVTDIEDYADATLELLARTAGLRNRYEAYAPRQTWRPETKFESRASNAGRSSFELWFERT